MKKIFRLANAELNKIFVRPSMFILATVLLLSLVLSFFVFAPKSTQTKFTYELNTTSAIFLKFEEKHENFENTLISAKTNIDEYLSAKNDTFSNLKTLSQKTKTRFYDHLYVAVLELPKTSTYPSEEDLSTIISEFETFKNYVKELRDYLFYNVIDKNVNFFVKTDELKQIYNTIKNIYETIPTTSQIKEYTTSAIIDRLNLLNESYDLNKINQQINGFERIEVNSQSLSNLLNTYYYTNIQETSDGTVTTFAHIGKLKELYDEIVNYYNQNISSSDSEILANLNERIAKYYDYINICSTLISNNFELIRIGIKSDDEIVTYNGFSGISIYNLKHDITIYDYFYKNNTFGYEYLNAFNFNVNSGTNTNAFDFAFYAMQILSSLIIVFVIFFACSAITGEQNSGTLKMTAIRPFTRNKIYSGKFLACLNVSLILLTVSLVASMAVGIATHGLTTQNVLVVMNASEVIVMNPFALMGIYLLTVILDIVFYIILAFLISMLIKPTTINTGITAGIFIASLIISGTVNESWIRFIPTMHLGLFKYFTTSSLGMFSFSVVPSTNFIVSLIIIIISIFACDLIGRLAFSQKNIDK